MRVAEGKVPKAVRLWIPIRLLDLPALFVGGVAAATVHRWGAYVLIVNLLVQFAGRLTVGAWAYWDVMSRPWPEVSALTDTDWDD